MHRSMEKPVIEIDEFEGVASGTRGERMADEVTDIAEDGAFGTVMSEQFVEGLALRLGRQVGLVVDRSEGFLGGRSYRKDRAQPSLHICSSRWHYFDGRGVGG